MKALWEVGYMIHKLVDAKSVEMAGGGPTQSCMGIKLYIYFPVFIF